MVVEPMAGDRLEDNLNRAADFNYAGSMMVCVPTSLSQAVGAAPGASRRGTGSRGNRGGRVSQRAGAAAPAASRRGTGSRGNRGGRLPERQARDGDDLQQGFASATVKPWR